MEKKYKSYGSYENCSKCVNDDFYLKKFINVEPKSIADENCGITKNDCNQKRVIKMGQGPTKSNLYLKVNSQIGPKHDIEFKIAQNNAQTVCNNVYTRECDPRLTNNQTWDKYGKFQNVKILASAAFGFQELYSRPLHLLIG